MWYLDAYNNTNGAWASSGKPHLCISEYAMNAGCIFSKSEFNYRNQTLTDDNLSR